MLNFLSFTSTTAGLLDRSVRRVLLGLAALLLIGCENPNEMFHGLWESTEPALSAPFQGAPTLALGHYGLEVTGVAYFHEAAGRSKLTPLCPCAFIVHEGVDLDAAVVRFSTEFEAADCGDDESLDWELVLSTDPASDRRVLQGTVIPSDGSTEASPIRLERASLYISTADRKCPPEAP